MGFLSRGMKKCPREFKLTCWGIFLTPEEREISTRMAVFTKEKVLVVIFCDVSVRSRVVG